MAKKLSNRIFSLLLVLIVVVVTQIACVQVMSRRQSLECESPVGKAPQKITENCLSFDICNGFTNQLIAIVDALMIANLTNRTVILPRIASDYRKMPDVDFGDVFDVDHLKAILTDVVHFAPAGVECEAGKVENWYFKRQKPAEVVAHLSEKNNWHIGCSFLSIEARSTESQELRWKIFKALRFIRSIRSQIEAAQRKIGPRFNVLHLRNEKDWEKHCQIWDGNNCGLQPSSFHNSSFFVRAFENEMIDRELPLYIASGTIKSDLRKSFGDLFSKYRVVTKEDILKNHQFQGRETAAAFDWGICENAETFIGDSVSTFSAVQMLERIFFGKSGFRYNSGDIPLEKFFSERIHHPKPFKFVFVWFGDETEAEISKMKFAVEYNVKNLSLRLICVFFGELDSVYEWLMKRNVTVILHRLPQQTKSINNKLVAELFAMLEISALGWMDEFLIFSSPYVLFNEHNLDNFQLPAPAYTKQTHHFSCQRIEIDARSICKSELILLNVRNMVNSYSELQLFVAKNLHVWENASKRSDVMSLFMTFFVPAQYRFFADGNWESIRDKPAVGELSFLETCSHQGLPYVRNESSLNTMMWLVKESPECNNFSYVVYAPPFSEKSGGIMVLYNLARRLERTGCKVFVAGASSVNPYNISTILLDKIDPEKFISVYPESVAGNPFQTKRYTHWLLYYPGIHGGSKSFPDDELILSYGSWKIADGIGYVSKVEPVTSPFQILLQASDWRLDLIVEKPLSNRSGCIYMVRKGTLFWSRDELLRIHETREKDKCTLVESFAPRDFCAICASHHYFHSYDPHSYYNVLAAMCGCVPVVHLSVLLKRSDLIVLMPLTVFGVAYGVDEIPHAEATRDKLLQHVKCFDHYSDGSVKHFVWKTQNWDLFFPSQKDESGIVKPSLMPQERFNLITDSESGKTFWVDPVGSLHWITDPVVLQFAWSSEKISSIFPSGTRKTVKNWMEGSILSSAERWENVELASTCWVFNFGRYCTTETGADLFHGFADRRSIIVSKEYLQTRRFCGNISKENDSKKNLKWMC
jgi:hypothetical protein